MSDGEAVESVQGSPAPGGRRRVILLVAVVVAALVAAIVTLPVTDYLAALLEWARGLGVWGPAIVAVVYVVACVLMLPGSVLTLGAGFLFGVVVGTITVSIGSTLGACAAFLVGRTVARRWIEKKIAGNEKFAAIDRAVGEQGFRIVLLTRLSPVFPFNVLNYGYGLTDVRLWQYALASWIGMLPGTVMYVYFGAGLGELAAATAGVETGAAGKVFFWVGLTVAIAVAVFVTRVARNALRQAVAETEDVPEQVEEG